MVDLCAKVGAGNANIFLALGHALIGNTHLQHLYLESLVLTEEAAHALAQGMAQSKIESLQRHGNCQENPSQESTQKGHICNVFYCGIKESKTIQHLSLYQSLTNDPGNAWRDALLGITKVYFMLSEKNCCHGYIQAVSHVLSRTTVLRELTVDFLKGTEPDDMTILACGLQQNTSITSLGLHNYGTTTQHLFAQRLNPNSAIIKLDLARCNLDDGCIELLVDHWLPNCSLEDLSLSQNEIGPNGARHLIQALANHPTMLNLDLSYNKGIGYKGLRLIGDELPNLHHLTHVNLQDCHPSWECYIEAEEAQAHRRACQQAGPALLDGIKHNVSITELLVVENGFCQVVLDEICFYTALNAMGRYLLSDDDGHGLPLSIWCHVFAKCQSQPNFGTSLVYFYLREQPALVQQQSCRL